MEKENEEEKGKEDGRVEGGNKHCTPEHYKYPSNWRESLGPLKYSGSTQAWLPRGSASSFRANTL